MGGPLPMAEEEFPARISLQRKWALYSWDFMEASPHGPEQLLTPFLLPLPSLEDEEWG